MCYKKRLERPSHFGTVDPDVAGEPKQNRIEDDEQNASPHDPNPMHLREMGFHSYTSCLIALVGVGPSALLAGILPLVFCREVVVNASRQTLS